MWICKNGVHGMALDQASGKKAFRKHHSNTHCLWALKLNVGWNSVPVNVQGRSLSMLLGCKFRTCVNMAKSIYFCGYFSLWFVFTVWSANFVLLNKAILFQALGKLHIRGEGEESHLFCLISDHEGILSLTDTRMLIATAQLCSGFLFGWARKKCLIALEREGEG